MNLSVNRRIRVIEENVTLIQRRLQGNGKILVQQGQEVSPSDLIGRSVISAGFRRINLSNILSVKPKDVKKHLQRSLGKVIYKGELLAYKGSGIFGGKKIVTAPTDGVLELLDDKTGILKLKILPHQVDLPSAVFGIIEKVDHVKKEVVIKTQVTQIYGVLGSGRSREGYLKILGDRGDLIGKDRISPELDDKIILGGGLIYNEALKEAVVYGVNGIISGGINASDFKGMSGGKIKFAHSESEVGIGVLITEGFGTIPIGRDIFEILKNFDDKFVILEGNKKILSLPSTNPDCLKNIRKIQLPKGWDLIPEISEDTLVSGMKIRIIGGQYMGEQGQVISIDNMVTTLPSGVITYMITVATESRKIKVPYKNVEIIDNLRKIS